MKEFEKSAMFAMMDQLEAQIGLCVNQLRAVRGLMYHIGEERPQATATVKPQGGKHGSPEYLGSDDEDEIEKIIEEQRLLGLKEQNRVQKEWDAQRAIIESEGNTL